jgi:hypothetical protein
MDKTTTAISGATDIGWIASNALMNSGAYHLTAVSRRCKPEVIFLLSRLLPHG